MEKLNKFFGKLYSSPSLLWKAGAGLIFLCFAFVVVLMPDLTVGFTNNTRWLFAGLMLAYALFRLYSCYAEYKSYGDE